jgi:Mg2+/Co2+ transporter CorC
VDDVNDLLKLQLQAAEYDTIGGYVLSQLGAMPKVGDTLTVGDAKLVVEAVRGTRIKRVRIHRDTPFDIPKVDQGEPALSTSPEATRPREGVPKTGQK